MKSSLVSRLFMLCIITCTTLFAQPPEEFITFVADDGSKTQVSKEIAMQSVFLASPSMSGFFEGETSEFALVGLSREDIEILVNCMRKLPKVLAEDRSESRRISGISVGTDVYKLDAIRAFKLWHISHYLAIPLLPKMFARQLGYRLHSKSFIGGLCGTNNELWEMLQQVKNWQPFRQIMQSRESFIQRARVNTITKIKHGGGSYSARFSPDGSKIVTISEDNAARILDAENYQVIATIQHGSRVRDAAFSPDSKTLLTSSSDRTAKLVRADDGDTVATIDAQNDWPWGVFSPDSSRAIIRRSYNPSLFLDTKSGEVIASIEGLKRVKFSPDGRTFVVVSAQHMSFFETATGTLIYQIKIPGVGKIVFSPDGNMLGVYVPGTFLGKDALILDIKSRRIMLTITNNRLIGEAVFTSDSTKFITMDGRAVTRVIDIARKKIIKQFEQEGRGRGLLLSPDGSLLLTLSGGDISYLITTKDFEVAQRLKLYGFTGNASFSGDGSKIISRSLNEAFVADLKYNNAVTAIVHCGEVNSAEFSPDSSKVITASIDGTAKILEIVSQVPEEYSVWGVLLAIYLGGLDREERMSFWREVAVGNADQSIAHRMWFGIPREWQQYLADKDGISLRRSNLPARRKRRRMAQRKSRLVARRARA